MTFQVIITRGDQWDTSYDVWVKRGKVPLEEGDGIFIGNYAITPQATTLSVATTLDQTLRWGTLVVPIRGRIGGPPGVSQP